MTSTAELEDRIAGGDPAASFELGVSLLKGGSSAVDAARGVQLVEAAAAQQHAEAAAMSAVFEAMGIGRIQSWQRALERLQWAAELGSLLAREQLRLLADPSCLAAHADDWQRLRASINAERLTSARERKVLSEHPRVRVIKGFATRQECRWLISRARDRLVPAATFDQKTGAPVHIQARSNTAVEFQVPDMDVIAGIIRARISSATGLPLPVFEPMQLLHYAPGQEFRPHYDFLDPRNPAYREQLRFGQRIATFLIYLNDGFEGGETDFPDAGIRYRGSLGDAIFWGNVDTDGSPDPLTRHAGLPPTSGEKWVLSQWIRDRSGDIR